MSAANLLTQWCHVLMRRSHELSSGMRFLSKQIRDNNFKKPPVVNSTKEQQFPDDIKLMAHQAHSEHSGKARIPTDVGLVSSASRQIRHNQRANILEAHESMTSGKITSQARTPRTPLEENQLLAVLGSDDNDDRPRTDSRARRRRAGSPSVADDVFEFLPAKRSTRSRRFKPRSPTPLPPERWTNNHPNWVEEENYQNPLIYERTTINATDIERLDEGQFLNDEIISFYSKYLHKQAESEDKADGKKVYVFNSFFWEKLRSSGHPGVKSWTTRVDLSTFDYIVVPINQSAHWYVAIICNPGKLLGRQDEAQTEDKALKQDDCPNQDGADQSATDERKSGTEGAAQSKSSPDMEPKLDSVTESMSQVSIDDQADGPVTVDLVAPAAPSTKKAKSAKRGPGPKKYDPNLARIIVLDSLGGSHGEVPTTLKKYLAAEFKDKKGIDMDIPRDIGLNAKDIPVQNNFTDCGVYLLGYLEVFMKDPYGFTEKIMQHETRAWDVNAPELRTKIRNLIFELQKKYQRDSHQQRRERALQRKTQSQTPPARSRPSTPLAVSEQPVPKSSAANSPNPPPSRQTPAPAPSRTSPLHSVNGANTSRRRTATRSLPNVQQKQISPTRVGKWSSPVNKSNQPADVSAEDRDANLTTNVTHSQSTDSKEPAPSPRHDLSSSIEPSPAASTSSTADIDSDEASNADDSMLVEHSRSFDTEQGQHAAGKDATPRPQQVVDSVGTVALDRLGQSNAPVRSSKSPTPRPSPLRSEAWANCDGHVDDGEKDEKNFLKPLASSQSTRRSSSATPRPPSKGREEQSRGMSSKSVSRNVTPNQDVTRSRFRSSPKRGSKKSFSGVTVLPSSEDEHTLRTDRPERSKDRRHEKKTSSVNGKSSAKNKKGAPNHIDLTSD